MTTEDELKFHDIAAAEVLNEAVQLLDVQLHRARVWEGKFWALHGRHPTFHDLITQVLSEPSERKPVLIAYSALIWKELHP